VIEERTGAENDRRPLTLLEVDMLISYSLGRISYRRCQLYQNLVCPPHRFARMFNYNQAVLDYTMDNVLHYLGVDMDKNLGVPSRHLLAHDFESASASRTSLP